MSDQGAKKNGLGTPTSDNEADNHNIVARINKRAGGEVRERVRDKGAKFESPDIRRVLAHIIALVAPRRCGIA